MSKNFIINCIHEATEEQDYCNMKPEQSQMVLKIVKVVMYCTIVGEIFVLRKFM